MKHTKGEILRNNWNSINDAVGEEKTLRISFQNNSCNMTDDDFDFYEKNMWNEKTEKKLKRKK